MVDESSIGISDSKTARIQMDKTELLKYCPVGLTGSDASSFDSIIRFVMYFFVLYLVIKQTFS